MLEIQVVSKESFDEGVSGGWRQAETTGNVPFAMALEGGDYGHRQRLE